MPVTFWNDTVYKGEGRKRSVGFGAWTNYSMSYQNTGTMTSLNHRMPVTGHGDVGGPFFLQKTDYECQPAVFNDNYIQGPILPTNTQNIMGDTTATPVAVSDSSLIAKGTTAIARCEPTNPTFSAATFIGEAREGAPSMVGISTWRQRTLNARAAGGEYLNVEFGWKPLLNDVHNFAYAVDNTHQILDAYHKGSGKKIRTGYDFPTVESSKTALGAITTTNVIYQGLGGVTEHTTFDQWFEGAFRYFLPVGDSQRAKMARYASDARKLYGLEITPEVLWNISPWTWAADWFSNAGDVLHNISAFSRDGLVMQYGYIMSKQVHTRKTWCIVRGQECSTTRTRTLKQRMPATPYGFGVNLSSLTSRQTAIIAALGLSRH